MKNSKVSFIIIVTIIYSLDSKHISSRQLSKDEKQKKIKYYSSDELSDLCRDPTISSANRFPNSTVRLYKDDEYWELKGLPDKEAFFSAHGNIFLKSMAPVKRNISIVAVLEGAKRERTYKFEREFFWTWDENGELISGGRGGEYWDQLPPGGFTAVFHNANQTDPMFIAFKEEKVYYYSTKNEHLELVGDSKGYVGGKFGENFPPDIDAAFTWPNFKSKGTFNLYMFREDKYCLRGFLPPKSGNYCDEWRENKELFGCLRGMTTIPAIKTSDIIKDITGQPNSESASGPDSQPEHGAIDVKTEEPIKSCALITCIESSILIFNIVLIFRLFI